MNTPVKFVAALKGVREVSLLGTADLSYWQEALAKEGLAPAGREGAAQVMVIAADARFRGIAFREVSFSVLVAPPANVPAREAAYLVAAFNSRRLFALSERVFFSTPYRHADLTVSASPPVAIEVRRRGRLHFAARMATDAADPAGRVSGESEGGWEGPVFVPSGGGASRAAGKYFIARISGRTGRRPFVESRDSFTIMSSRQDAVFAALRDSGFAPREWAVRVDAEHAKSNTYARTAPPTGPTL
jgi:hypothetical protein